MQKLLKEYLDELNKRQKKKRKARIAMLLLAVLVMGSVGGVLAQYGIAMTGTAYCGAEAHTHGEECYEQSLICSIEEAKAHAHSQECYEQELICVQEESEEHTHSQECYGPTENVICAQEAQEGHTHMEGCYELQLACGLEEHTHTDICYIDKNADVEEQVVWERQYAGVQWKDAWGEDLVTAARRQIGYQESINNYQVAEDGSHKGYTRYGAFVGDPYCDWDAAFVSFCMYYAGLMNPELGVFPIPSGGTDAGEWRKEFTNKRQENRNYLTGPEEYIPAAGDLIFFQREGEETAQQMGIVSAYAKDGGQVHVIEGNNANGVRENTYDGFDSRIIGYVKVAELEADYKEIGEEPGEESEPSKPEDSPQEPQEPGESQDSPQEPEESQDSSQEEPAEEEDTAAVQETESAAAPRNGTMGPDEAYVNEIKITEMVTGSAPFDEAEGRGNDTTGEDKLVRTFDTVTYNFNVNMKSWDLSKTYSQARVKLEFVLPLSEKEAVFEQTAMAWMDQTEGYKPVLTTETREIDGVAKECQVLTCYKLLLPSEGNISVVPGDFGDNLTINVRAMKNGETFTPIISAAMEGGTWDGPCEKEAHKIDGEPALEKKTVIPEPVEVTAAPKYNIQLKGEGSYSDDFNFQGDEAWMAQYGNVAANTDIAKPLPGRAMKLGITLQLYNDNASKGLKGIELPDGGDITFDLKVSSIYTVNTPNEGSSYQEGQEITDAAYMPLLWSYNEVDWKEYGSQNKDGRQIDDRLKATPLAPYNSGGGKNACYNGGSWTASQEGDTIHIRVSGYEIDPLQMPVVNGDEGIYVTYDANVGCFSSGEIWLIQPFNQKESDSTKPNYDVVSAYGSGFFATTAEAGNMKITTASGETLVQGENGFQQMVTDDDRDTHTLELTLNGYVQNRVRYADAETYILGCGIEDNRDGRDYAAVGAELNLMGGLSYNPNRIEENRMYLGTTLLKFYGTALELPQEEWFLSLEGGAALNGHDETQAEAARENVRIYYAVKQDGSDWVSDQELKTTYEDSLVFYESLSQIPAGKICVGMLISYIGPGGEINASDPYYLCYHKAKVKDNMDLAGQTFMLASTSRVWTKGMFEEAGLGLEDIDLEKNPGLNVPELIQSDKFWNCGHYTSANIAGSTFYEKEVYRPDGSGIEGKHNSDWYHWGDTLLIVGYKTKITKNLLQKNENGEEKNTFSLDAGQRVADFKLQPAAYYDKPGEFNNKAPITIVDTLPKYMTYKPGSAYFGGKYVQTSDLGGTQGNIVADEASETEFSQPMQNEPVVKKNEDGTQTLTWVIPDVEIGAPMAPIYYSVEIGEKGNPELDIPTGTTDLKNVVYITTPRDLRDPETTAEKHAEAGISVIRGSASSFGKYTKQKVVDEDGVIDYVVYFNNNADTGTEVSLMDAMPMNDVDNGLSSSKFTGTYTFEKWKLDTSKCDVSKLKIYYTFDTDYKGKTAKEVPQEEIVTWKEATIGSDGNIAIPTEAEGATEAQPYPVVWAVVGTLEARRSVNIELQIQLNPGTEEEERTENNRFVNLLSSGDTTTITETPTVRRTLEGLTWMDYNRDGIQGEPQQEERISGVKVELLKLKEGEKGKDPEDESCYENVCYPNTGSPIIIGTGQQISVRAENISGASDYEAGRYKFTDLPAGTYAIRFSDWQTETEEYPKILSELNATEANCGTDDTIDSDGEPVYEEGKLKKTLILNLKMPKAEEMSVVLYESKNHDSGFYPNTQMQIQKVDESGANPLSGAIFTIQDSRGQTMAFTKEGEAYTPVVETDPALEGKYYIAYARNPRYVIGLSGTGDGSVPVLQLREKGNSMQLFDLVEHGTDENGRLVSFRRMDSSQWLDLDGGNLYDGAKIHIWSNTAPNDNQKWYVKDVDGGSHISPYIAQWKSPYHMDLNGGTPSQGGSIHLWQANDTDAQKWVLIPAAGSKDEEAAETGAELWSDSSAPLTIRNLIPGDYTITEIKSPNGYSLLREPIRFTLNTDNTVTVNSSMADVVQEGENSAVLRIRNEELYELPSAGGMGIYWCTIGGVLLMAAASWMTYRSKILIRKGE